MTSTQPPAPRILTEEEYDLAYERLADAAYRNGSRLGETAAHGALTETLAAIGVFIPAPDAEAHTCTARYLPHDAAQFDVDILGVWQQCADDPGHDGTEHDSGDLSWSDEHPGALPAVQ